MIKPKEKKCKGTGKASGFGCGKMVLDRVYGIGKFCCYYKFLYESEAGKDILNKTINKVTAPRKSLENAFKKNKEKKGIAGQLLYTKDLVHKMVRLRDEFKPCISCNAPWNDTFQAGHFYPAGNFRSIKFEFLNINGQCMKCNLMKEGNFENYRINLPGRIGPDNFKIIEDLAKLDKKFNKHWSIEELKLIQKEARKIIKDLK